MSEEEVGKMAHTLSIEIPVSLEAEPDLERWKAAAGEGAVLALWQAGLLSTRQAARSLRLTYYDFLDLLASRGLPVVDDDDNADALEAYHRQAGGSTG
jgi:predicted HTH domain antitoxin